MASRGSAITVTSTQAPGSAAMPASASGRAARAAIGGGAADRPADRRERCQHAGDRLVAHRAEDQRAVGPPGFLKVGGQRACAVGVVGRVEQHLRRSICEPLEAAGPDDLGQPGADCVVAHGEAELCRQFAARTRRPRRCPADAGRPGPAAAVADRNARVAALVDARNQRRAALEADCRRSTRSASAGRSPADRRGTPGLTMPAFSKAIDSRVSPSCA